MTVKTQQIYYNLLLQGNMFRLLRVIISPSNEPTENYLIPSALWDPVAQASATCDTRVKRGTWKDFQWHAE